MPALVYRDETVTWTNCDSCLRSISPTENVQRLGRHKFCATCGPRYASCTSCSGLLRKSSGAVAEHEGQYYCSSCVLRLRAPVFRCCNCRSAHPLSEALTSPDPGVGATERFCPSCFDSQHRNCPICQQQRYVTLMWRVSGRTDRVCRGCCEQHYFRCTHCGNYHPQENRITIPGRRGPFCPDCQVYFQLRGSLCKPADLNILIRSPIYGEIKQETKYLIKLGEKETVSPAGVKEIQSYLCRNTGYYPTPDCGFTDWQWQTSEGNLPKRIAKWFKKRREINLPLKDISEIGNLAKQHLVRNDEILVSFTRNLNLPAEEFFHPGSCWWNSYAWSRCTMKHLGGIGMRTYNAKDEKLNGRAWILPVKMGGWIKEPAYDFLERTPKGEGKPNNWNIHHYDIKPNLVTHTSTDSSMWLLFNGYGFRTKNMAEMFATIVGLQIAKINATADRIYINRIDGDRTQSYLIASTDLCEHYKDSKIEIKERPPCKCKVG